MACLFNFCALLIQFSNACQTAGKDRHGTTSKELVCECEFQEDYEICKSTVDDLQSQVSSLNGSVTRLTDQVSRCTAIQQEVFFHQYIRTLLQQLSRLAAPVSVHVHCTYCYHHHYYS